MRLERGETWTKRIGWKTRGGNGGRRRGGDETDRTEKGCTVPPDTQAWECMHETNWKPSERRTRRNGERRMDGLTSCLHVRRNHGKKDTRTNTMASAEVIWGCVRNNSAFLRKGVNGTQFAAEPGNLTHRNSFKCSGESNEYHDARTEHQKDGRTDRKENQERCLETRKKMEKNADEYTNVRRATPMVETCKTDQGLQTTKPSTSKKEKMDW